MRESRQSQGGYGKAASQVLGSRMHGELRNLQ
jgi:hypothetical protein